MIKSAIEYVLGLSKANVIDVNGEAFFMNHDGVQRILPDKPCQPSMQAVTTLGSIVEYIERNTDGSNGKHNARLIIHIESPTKVSLKTESFGYYEQRTTLIESKPMIPELRFDQFMDAEAFNIYMQSKFVQNADRDIILQVVGNIQEDNVGNTGDDGVSQTVNVKVGVVTTAKVKVPNPVSLAPYRTFIEVEQPESKFVFRMKQGPSCALFEADGGAWKIHAMENISEFFQERLKDIIEDDKIIILS